jgi:murein DD-endopeptidase MepM/ murein hydrolase activator NlpD
MRYIITIALIIAFIIPFMWSSEKNEINPVQQPEKTIQLVKDIVPEPVKNFVYDPEEPGQGLNPFWSRIGMRPVFNKPYDWFYTIEVESGDTLGELVEDTGVSGPDYFAALGAIEKYVDPVDIKPGHKIVVSNTRYKGTNTINEIVYMYDSLTSVKLTKDETGKWQSELLERPLSIITHAARTTVQNSLYGSMGAADVPDGIINRMIKAYSWTVDFQRDIWGGEEIEVLYETKETDDGSYVRSNRLIYANLKLRDRDLPIYLYEKEDGIANYFDPAGLSIKRTLMKTPVDGARLSSGYGMRKHPVLGYNKMHKGLDFAAPTGTPIYAAGDGTVERANRFGAYGNYIRIRHNETYKTAYAHLHKFAKGISSGSRVKQGQVIGYVGSTGRSTGPHLHYEVLKNGKQVNPHSVDLPLGEQLTGQQLANFKAMVAKRNAEFKSLLSVVAEPTMMNEEKEELL